MQYITTYVSPMGKMLLAADEIGLIGLWFEGQKYYARSLSPIHEEKEVPVLKKTIEWLENYFSGNSPKMDLPLHFIGSEFQIKVWELLCEIPYGETCTYGQIARKLAQKEGKSSMSAQAVGGAVGHNHMSIIVPCHRVLGTNGSLTGYAGGLDKKIELLKLEGTWQNRFFMPHESRTV